MRLKHLHHSELDAAVRTRAEMPKDAEVGYILSRNKEGTFVLTGATAACDVPDGWEVHYQNGAFMLYAPMLDKDGKPVGDENGDVRARAIIQNAEAGPPFPYVVHREDGAKVSATVESGTINEAVAAVRAVMGTVMAEPDPPGDDMAIVAPEEGL